ncbi:MAG: pentapeptide repeat-containing protein [Lapillicoccus sp.]
MPELTEFAATALRPEEDYDGVAFRDLDLSDQQGTNARFLDCEMSRCDLSRTVLSRSRWSDCRLEQVRGVGVDLSEATLLDVSLTGARLGALAAYGSSWRRVRVRGGKVDFLNLRGATLREVVFEDCVLVEPDLAGATLASVSFRGCTLVEPELGGAAFTAVDLSGAHLREPRGLASLRGATISRLQLLELADSLAAQLGITVAE